MHRKLLFALVAGALLASPLAAQSPRGAVIKIDNLAVATSSSPQVAATPKGDFVVVWRTDHIWVRLFRADGTPKTKQLRVSNSPVTEYGPRLAVGADGAFVVVWASGSNITNIGVFGRRFNADGTPRGPRFRLNSTPKGIQYEPAVAFGPDGSFVTTWTSEGPYDFGLPNVWARRFDAAGQPLGSDFHVNVTTFNERESPQVAVSASGDFVIGWASWNGEDLFDLMIRRFAQDGTPETDELPVVESSTNQYEFALGMAPDGSFVVLWTDPGAGNTGDIDDNVGILGQRFTAEGEPRTDQPFPVNGAQRGVQDEPAVAVAADGSFVALWRSHASQFETGPASILTRRFASDGRPLGNETLVDPVATRSGNLYYPAVALDRDGQGLAVWNDYGAGIFARRLVP
jgi:hypothetical protein